MTAADLPAVLWIQALCYTDVTPESRQSLHSKLEASRSTCLIARIGQGVAAYLISLPWHHGQPPALNEPTCRLPPSPNCLYLHDLAVAPQARASGAGRALVDAFLSRLKQSDLGRASLVPAAPRAEAEPVTSQLPSPSYVERSSSVEPPAALDQGVPPELRQRSFPPLPVGFPISQSPPGTLREPAPYPAPAPPPPAPSGSYPPLTLDQNLLGSLQPPGVPDASPNGLIPGPPS